MNEHISARHMIPDLPQPARRMAIAVRALQALTIVAELLLIAGALTGHGWETLALGHLAIVVILTCSVILLERMQAETGQLQVFTLLTFAGGPVGGVASLLGAQPVWQPKGDVLDKWYSTIAPPQTAAVTLVDMIIDGRLVRQQSRLPRPYDVLLNGGTMAEKQALLAYLAIEDDEKFVEVALALALRSTDQRVRVQAAAVAAHTRNRSRRRQPDAPGFKAVQAALPGSAKA